MKTYPKTRIELVIEEAALPRIIDAIDGAGAHGYTVLPGVSGRGNRGRRSGDPFSGVSGNVLVWVIAGHEVALRIVESCQHILENYAGVIFLSEVQVLRDEHF
jgi:PII-like signaling protein